MTATQSLAWFGVVTAPAVCSAVFVAPAAAQVTQRVSVSLVGVQGNSTSTLPSVSADGRYVAFASSANNLVNGDTNSARDVFVRDRLLATTERVSVDSAGVQGGSISEDPSISADGRYVAFQSFATNLVSGDTNGTHDVFIRDRLLGTTERINVDSAGAQGNSYGMDPSISADGRYVAFESAASNLVSGDTNNRVDVFVRDRQLGTTERVSVDSTGAEGNDTSDHPSIDADGRNVAFRSLATNLVGGDINGTWDAFVRDRLVASTEHVSRSTAGVQGNGECRYPTISGDGRYVAFGSLANNLVAGDTNGAWDVFLRDRSLNTTARVSVDSAGAQSNGTNVDFYRIAISGDGRYVAFASDAANLVVGDSNGSWDVFVRDRQLSSTGRVSVSTAGVQGNNDSGGDSTGLDTGVSISPDGRYVAFGSLATNLVSLDGNGVWDAFLRDRDETGFLGFCYPEIAGVRSCPCGNPATASDLGCDNYINTTTVSGTGGAKLTASGAPNASLANTLVFHVTKAHNPGSNTNLHVFWRGTSTLAVGVKSGFGVRCVAGSLKRIYQGSGTGTGGLGSTNAVDFPNGTQTTDAWTASLMPAAGTTLYYYDSFRDQQGPTTCNTSSDRFNVSHAGAVTWIP